MFSLSHFLFNFHLNISNHFEINSHEQAKEVTLTKRYLAIRASQQNQFQPLEAPLKDQKEGQNIHKESRPQLVSSQWTSSALSEKKLKRTTKMTQSLSARTTSIESEMRLQSKLRINSCKKRSSWINKRLLHWLNLKQRNKKWSLWMNRELKKCNQLNNRNTKPLKMKLCYLKRRKRWTMS